MNIKGLNDFQKDKGHFLIKYYVVNFDLVIRRTERQKELKYLCRRRKKVVYLI